MHYDYCLMENVTHCRNGSECVESCVEMELLSNDYIIFSQPVDPAVARNWSSQFLQRQPTLITSGLFNSKYNSTQARYVRTSSGNQFLVITLPTAVSRYSFSKSPT